MEDDVRVRAVVMTRDDSSGGWVPLGGGGLSHVTICKGRSPENKGQRDYIIRGQRLRDGAPVLECGVQRGLVYNKVNPIFHHWRVEDRKFGLTFQSPADAVSFEQDLHSAIDRLDREDCPLSSTPEDRDSEDEGQTIHGCPTNQQPPQASVILNPPEPPPPPPAPPTPPPARPPPSPLAPALSLLEEGGVRGLEPCRDTWGSRSYQDYGRAGSTRTAIGGLGGGVIVGGAEDKAELCVVHFEKNLAGVGVTGCEVAVTLDSKATPSCAGPAPTLGKGSPSPCCIHTALTTPLTRTRRRGGGVAGGGASACRLGPAVPPLVSPDDGGPRLACSARCVYCRVVSMAAENARGRCLQCWMCAWCAERLLCHCAADAEGHFCEPCSCEEATPPGGRPHPLCCARWAALLAIFVPCMCCYLPLHACLRCREHCSCCGGRHQALR